MITAIYQKPEKGSLLK